MGRLSKSGGLVPGSEVVPGNVIVFPRFALENLISGTTVPEEWESVEILEHGFKYTIMSHGPLTWKTLEEAVIMLESFGKTPMVVNFYPVYDCLLKKHLLKDYWAPENRGGMLLEAFQKKFHPSPQKNKTIDSSGKI